MAALTLAVRLAARTVCALAPLLPTAGLLALLALAGLLRLTSI